MTASATTPTGRLMKKTQCQPKPSVMKPPTSGPTTLDRPNTLPKSPWYLPRSAGGKRSATTAKALVKSAALPSPCTTLKRMSGTVPHATPHRKLPARKTRMPATRVALRPNRSDSLPHSGTVTVEATRYEVVSHG